MGEAWFLARTLVSKEKFALSNLTQRGFDCYLPLTISAWQDRFRDREPVVRCFLPNYLFFRCDLEDDTGRWHRVFNSPGVASVLCSGQKPESVPGWIIDEIKGREVHGLVQLPPPTVSARQWRAMLAKFKRGDTVGVKGAGLDAIFIEMRDDRQRADIFVSLLGKVHRKTVPLSRLYKAEAS